MKNFWIIFGLIFFTIFTFVQTPYFNKIKSDFLEYANYMECMEDGICKEGVTVGSGENQYVINEQTCIEHKGKWNETYCYLY